MVGSIRGLLVSTVVLGAFLGGNASAKEMCADVAIDANLTPFIRNVIAYYLTAFVPPEVAKQAWQNRRTLKAEDLPLAEKVLPFFPKAASDLDTLRRLKDPDVSELYNAFRLTRHPAFLFPLTREEFREIHRYDLAKYDSDEPLKWVWDTERKWRRRIIPVSSIKGKMRVLYRPAADHLSVAVTHSNSGAMLETEIALKREDESGNWDFYAYDTNGQLAIRSVFSTTPGQENDGPTPYTCLACHYSPDSQTFLRVPSLFNRMVNPGMMLIDGRL